LQYHRDRDLFRLVYFSNAAPSESRQMTKEDAAASTRTSRIISARAEELNAAFLERGALVNWLPPAEVPGKTHEFGAGVGGIPDTVVLPRG
jgi:hypothetical protein